MSRQKHNLADRQTDKFLPLAVSSKFAICGLPIRMDTYKTCSFGCKYCFANHRKVMEFEKELSVANVEWLERKLSQVESGNVKATDFLGTLISMGITFHCGGMSDPFQPCEREYHATRDCVDVCNKHQRSILFSTKSDTVHDTNIRSDLHNFQLSVTGGETLEPNVPKLQCRKKFYRSLKQDGFKVGIRIQPFIPNVTTLEIVKEFQDADHFILEGIKIVPQNEEHKELILTHLGLSEKHFTQMGLLNLKPEIRLRLYKPFIDFFEEHGMSYSIADNDMHHLGNNYCCCGDSLIKNQLLSANTAMSHIYGRDYSKEQLDEMLDNEGIRDCVCNHLFTSNRQGGFKTVQQFYDNRFYRASSPFSPLFATRKDEQVTLFDLTD